MAITPWCSFLLVGPLLALDAVRQIRPCWVTAFLLGYGVLAGFVRPCWVTASLLGYGVLARLRGVLYVLVWRW